MTDSFSDRISALFKEKEVQHKLPVDTLFEGIYLPEYRLQLHLISITHPSANTVEGNYFSLLSDQASQQNIRLIHLWSDVYHNHKALTEARLLALTGKRKRVHARQTTIVRLDKKQADDFLNKHHLQQSAGAYYKYGLVINDEIIAVATFSKSRVMTDGPVPYRSYELVRFASQTGTTVTGGLSKLLKHFVTEHHAVHIMTYADRDWSSGAGYEKLGFNFIETTPSQIFYIHPDEGIRYPQFRLPPGVTEEALIQRGYVKIANSGNLKYILDKRSC